jgi:hypothetical protein
MLFTVQYIFKKTNTGFRRQMSHLSVQTKSENFLKPAGLSSKSSTTSKSSIDE